MKIAMATMALVLSMSTLGLADGWREGGHDGGWHGGHGDGYGHVDGESFLLLLLAETSTLNCAASGECKQLVAAKDDAAAFVATDGEIRSAALNEAINLVKGKYTPADAPTDMEIALTIVEATK